MGTTVDWNRWLPPRKIRDWGFIDLKAGQVWAWRDDFGSVVFRVTKEHPGQHAFDVEMLASNGSPGHMDVRHVHGVLVQDVGQREPAPPGAIWQDAYALPPDLCYADACTSVRVMGRDEHGKAYCWKHRALWGTVTREVANEQTMANMGKALAASMDKSMMDVFQAAGLFLNEGPGADRRTRLKVGDCVSMGDDGLLCAATREDRVPIGVVIAKDGANAVVRQGICTLEFKIGPDLALDELPDYDHLADPMPLMRATIPDYGASGYRYQPLLDDRPRSHASTKPTPKSEKEIYQLQKLNDGDRKRVELFPERPARPIYAGARMTADHFGAFVVRDEPKPPRYVYPEISEDDLLPDV